MRSNHPLLDAGQRLVVGHRGNAMYAPENTMISAEQAVAAGADAIEIDVHLSADGEAVVIHDPTVSRTTGGTGWVSQLDMTRLRALDAGSQFSSDLGATRPYRGQGIRIPTLAEMLHSFPNIPFVIEIKAARAQERVIQVVRDLDAAGRVVLASFDGNALIEPRARGFRTGATRPELAQMFVRSALGFSQRKAPFDAVFVPRRYRGVPLTVHPTLRAGRALSVPIHTWVENNIDVARRLWHAGVSGIVTDAPGALRSALK